MIPAPVTRVSTSLEVPFFSPLQNTVWAPHCPFGTPHLLIYDFDGESQATVAGVVHTAVSGLTMGPKGDEVRPKFFLTSHFLCKVKRAPGDRIRVRNLFFFCPRDRCSTGETELLRIDMHGKNEKKIQRSLNENSPWITTLLYSQNSKKRFECKPLKPIFFAPPLQVDVQSFIQFKWMKAL